MEYQRWDRRPNALGVLQVLGDDTLCKIISLLSPRDIGTLACVSSVFNIFCNEEPLWMQICLETHQGCLHYKGTWKHTALAKLGLINELEYPLKPPRQFPGFTSIFLYQRWYRCHVVLEGFAKDTGAVERRSCVQPEEFLAVYDGKKPVLITDLLDDWPAKKTWSLDHLKEKCGDAEFKVTQPHGPSVPMNLRDFAGYMDVQHDEEPLYIFDPQFGEAVPELLDDYKVPNLFSDDLFSYLCDEERPPYRWLVLGPARSGASWHVDPSLTSAWNSLLTGRKRWALYPPGKVPPGVTLDVDEDDGSIRYDGPHSLQWWLDVYPHLDEAHKPLECTQLPGETIYVPSGWWHCVLNIDSSIAVTQNFANVNNLEIVCMDLAPGYRHRAIARAGLIVLGGQTVGENLLKEETDAQGAKAILTSFQKKGRPLPISKELDEDDEVWVNGVRSVGGVTDKNLLLALDALRIRPKSNKDFTGETNEKNSMGESMIRKWLRMLWVERPELQPQIWKGACLAFDAGTWLHMINVICTTYGFPLPVSEEQLPVGDGTNPVFFVGNYVIKLYIQEAGPPAALDALGSELEFYALLKESESPFREVVPEMVTSGILYPDGDDYHAVPWDGMGDCPLVYTREVTLRRKRSRDSETTAKGSRFRTKWSTKTNAFETDRTSPLKEVRLWPYLVTRRLPGRILTVVRRDMTEENLESLCAFLGQELQYLHTLPLVTAGQTALDKEQTEESLYSGSHSEEVRSRDMKEAKYDNKSTFRDKCSSKLTNGTSSPMPILTPNTNRPQLDAVGQKPWEVPKAWEPFVSFLRKQRVSVVERLETWGCLPDFLLKQLETYLPKDPVVLVGNIQVLNGVVEVSTPPVWLHMDMMSDNILVEESEVSLLEPENNLSKCTCNHKENGLLVSDARIGHANWINPRYILDYGDIIHGDPLCDLLPLHLDVFNLEGRWMECFLKSYQLPLAMSPERGVRHLRGTEGVGSDRQYTLSYCAMCYCLLHELDALSTIFKLRDDVMNAETLEEIEQKVWGILNTYDPKMVEAS